MKAFVSFLVGHLLLVVVTGGFIVARERPVSCSGSVTLKQGSRPHQHVTVSTPSLARFNRRQEVSVRVEGNCCWALHSRRRFRGHKTILRRQGDIFLSSRLVKSVSNVDCGSVPWVVRGGLNWVGGIGALLFVTIMFTLMMLRRGMKKKRDVEKGEEEEGEMKGVEEEVKMKAKVEGVETGQMEEQRKMLTDLVSVE